MADAQDVFDTEWDPFSEPKLHFDELTDIVDCVKIDLDGGVRELPPAGKRAQALTLWFTAEQFDEHVVAMQKTISQVLQDCPHSSMQVILEPSGDPTQVTSQCVEQLLATCYAHPNYLDRYYSLNPQGLLGSKRVLVVVDDEVMNDLDPDWADTIEETATLVVNKRLSSNKTSYIVFEQ